MAGPSGDEDPPEETTYLWNAFLELNARRAVGAGLGGVVISPITHENIRQWSSALGMVLSPWEVSAISRLDDVYLAEQRKQSTAKK